MTVQPITELPRCPLTEDPWSVVASFLPDPHKIPHEMQLVSRACYRGIRDKAWQQHAAYLEAHPDTFTGKIYTAIRSCGPLRGPDANSRAIEQVFRTAKNRVGAIARTLNHPPLPTLPRYAFAAMNDQFNDMRSEAERKLIDIIQGIATQHQISYVFDVLQHPARAVDYLKVLLDHPAIMPDDLRRLIESTAYYGHIDCLNTIIQSPRFSEIYPGDLGAAFWRAAFNGYLECLNAIIQSNRFGEIDPNDLGLSLIRAAENGHLDCLGAIIQSNRFSEIDPENLKSVFRDAVFEKHFDCLIAIIQSNRFGEISPEDLKWAFIGAAENGHLDCLSAIIQSNRFGEIDPAHLDLSLVRAATNGHLDCLNAIIQSPRFDEIPLPNLGQALQVTKNAACRKAIAIQIAKRTAPLIAAGIAAAAAVYYSRSQQATS